MKSVTIFLTLILVALTGAALATPDDGIDSFGIYFGPDLVTNCASVSLFTPFNLYFMVANPSSPVISSFEVSWHYEPAPPNAPAILGVTFPPNALNIGDDHNFIVGLSSAMPTTPATILVTVALLATSPITDIDIMGCNASYVGQSGEVEMTYSTYDPENGWDIDHNGCIAVARYGCPAPVASESATFGAVKALYR